MGMRETRNQLRFLQKAVHVLGRREASLQDFDGHLRFEVDVLCQVDIGKRTSAEELNESIIAQLLSDAICHACTCLSGPLPRETLCNRCALPLLRRKDAR